MALFFGKGIFQIFSMIAGWFLWAYLWCVFAATGIYFVHSNFDIVDTLENVFLLVVYPLIEIVMDLFVVWPYKYIWCPVHRWWSFVHIPLVKEGSSPPWNTLSEADKQNVMIAWSKNMDNHLGNKEHDKQRAMIIQEGTRIINDAEEVWNNDSELSNGVPWVQPIKETKYAVATPNSTSTMWSWNIPKGTPEYNYMDQIFEDIAEPIYNAKKGYTAPKYCKEPGEPIAKGCMKPPQSIFSWEWWLCKTAHLENKCVTKCQ